MTLLRLPEGAYLYFASQGSPSFCLLVCIKPKFELKIKKKTDRNVCFTIMKRLDKKILRFTQNDNHPRLPDGAYLYFATEGSPYFAFVFVCLNHM